MKDDFEIEQQFHYIHTDIHACTHEHTCKYGEYIYIYIYMPTLNLVLQCVFNMNYCYPKLTLIFEKNLHKGIKKSSKSKVTDIKSYN